MYKFDYMRCAANMGKLRKNLGKNFKFDEKFMLSLIFLKMAQASFLNNFSYEI